MFSLGGTSSIRHWKPEVRIMKKKEIQIKIRNVERDKDLTKIEIKEYRKAIGKLSWLANSKCPDLIYTALTTSKKNNSANISDLMNI